MSHINSSALSDDGKFSTKALRQFATQDIEYEAVNKLGPDSTHVEFSDKGSRKYPFHHYDERIVEEDEEGSGRTSPPGTIGEVHEYMSENIETVNKIAKKKVIGNASVTGKKESQGFVQKPQQQVVSEKEEQDVEACSTFAVIREKIPLTNDNKHVQAFKMKYDQLFNLFQAKLKEEYAQIKT